MRKSCRTMTNWLALTLLGALVLTGWDCSVSLPPTNQAHIRANVRLKEEVLPPYASRRFYTIENNETANFLVLKIEPALWSWGLAEDPAKPKSVAAWREASGATAVLNAAYFTESGEPSGYWKNTPTVPVSAISWPKKGSGYTGTVMIKDGALALAYLPSDAPDPAKSDAIFLTFPTLIADGRPLVEKETGLKSRRTALAEDQSGTDYIIITEEGIVSLHQFSRWLSEQPERFTRAVNLDGGPSTGLSLKDGGEALEIPSAPVPNVLLLRRR
ncbi:hypothetical protein EPN90_03130 [Patescibacteria group bacterium]|nr:MAG: hypothetical protein EPN90_03130 [Patescibacteria group bacterium]